MAVLCNIDDNRLFPSKQEVANSGTNDDGKTEPHVVRHEDEHEEAAEHNLHDV